MPDPTAAPHPSTAKPFKPRHWFGWFAGFRDVRWEFVALTLGFGALGGWVFNLANLPLAWMLGAMIATTFVAVNLGHLRRGILRDLELGVPRPLSTSMMAVLGVMVGSRFTSSTFDQASLWIVSLTGLVVFVVLTSALAYFYLHKVIGYDRATSFFAGMPGGFSEMMMLAPSFNADVRVVVVMHGARILLLVLTLPFILAIVEGGLEIDRSGAIDAPLPPLRDLLIMLSCAVCGAPIARMLRLPAPFLTGPMILSAALHMIGFVEGAPPWAFIASAQIVMGCAAGSRFAGVPPHAFVRLFVVATGMTLVLLAATVGCGWVLAELTGLTWINVIIGLAPGGMPEMNLIALALAIGPGFVAVHQTVRIVMLVFLAPIIFRLLTGQKADHEASL